jgi:G:T/U-mismatch repair DNA glycosylase
LPGAASLAARQYYAQPHNAFWRIMGELFGAGPDVPYAARADRLRASGIALWDVCREAVRRCRCTCCHPRARRTLRCALHRNWSAGDCSNVCWRLDGAPPRVTFA